MRILTDTTIKALKARPHNSRGGEFIPYRVFDAHTKGLHIQVTQKGTKNWTVSYSFQGERQYHKIGSYPATGIAEARRRAADIWAQVESGKNPKILAKEATRSQKVATVEDLAAAYLADCERRQVRTIPAIKRIFDREVIPKIGALPVTAVTTEDIHRLLRPIVERDARGMADHVRQALRAAFQFGLSADYNLDIGTEDSGRLRFGLTINPVVPIPRPATSRAEEHYPSMPEIREMYERIVDFAEPPVAFAIQMHLASCGQRVTEISTARWDQLQTVQLGDESIPCLFIPRTKIGNPHVIPIGRHMAEVLVKVREYSGDCNVLFPQRWSTGQPVSANSINHAHRRARIALGQTEWSPRTVRRAVKTHLGDAGISMEHRDIMQNHGQRASISQRHYDRALYLEQKCAAMNRWDHLLNGGNHEEAASSP